MFLKRSCEFLRRQKEDEFTNPALAEALAKLKNQNKRIDEKGTDPLFYVYILECNDGTLYTGWTVNIEKRLAMHNGEKGPHTHGQESRLYLIFGNFSYKERSDAARMAS